MHIETIGVIGANPVGRGIALAALIGGYRVVLEDVSSEMLEKGIAYIGNRSTTMLLVTNYPQRARLCFRPIL